MEAYSQDLRDRVLRALERGERPTAIATRCTAHDFLDTVIAVFDPTSRS
jgi:hypothetical protein